MNWSWAKKHGILILIAFASFAGDFGAASGIPCVIAQGREWNISPVKAGDPNSLAAILGGVCGIIFMPLLNSWGRMPVLFWTNVTGLLFTLGATLARDFETHYAMRCLQSVVQESAQTIGLAFVKDCFFFHEHARKIGIWYAIYIASPFMSPLLGNFIMGTVGEWRDVFWMVFGWCAFVVMLMIFCGDETYYNRTIPVERQPSRPKGLHHRLMRVTGIWQIRYHKGYFTTIFSSYRRLVHVFLKPIMPITMLAYSGIFMWSVGINITSSILLVLPQSEGGYGLSPISLGYVFFTPVVAVLIGEVIGHWLNDSIVRIYGDRHKGLFVPEVRLWTTYIGGFFMIPGLVLVGQTLLHHLNIAGIVFGWGMYQSGLMLTSVAIVAFVLDCYPSASGEVSALINLGRLGTGFSVGYFQQSWGQKSGYGVTFGLQALVVALMIMIIIFIQIFGKQLRKLAGPVKQVVV